MYRMGGTSPHRCLLGGLATAAEIILEFVDMVYHPEMTLIKKITAMISCTIQTFAHYNYCLPVDP